MKQPINKDPLGIDRTTDSRERRNKQARNVDDTMEKHCHSDSAHVYLNLDVQDNLKGIYLNRSHVLFIKAARENIQS